MTIPEPFFFFLLRSPSKNMLEAADLRKTHRFVIGPWVFVKPMVGSLASMTPG